MSTNIRIQDMDIVPQICSTNAEWRSWLTGCLCSTEFHALVAPTSTVRSSKPLTGGRDSITLCSLDNKALRCPCCGSGRQMVSRIGAVFGAARQGQSASRAKGDAGQRSVRLDEAVEVHVGLRRRPSFVELVLVLMGPPTTSDVAGDCRHFGAEGHELTCDCVPSLILFAKKKKPRCQLRPPCSQGGTHYERQCRVGASNLEKICPSGCTTRGSFNQGGGTFLCTIPGENSPLCSNPRRALHSHRISVRADHVASMPTRVAPRTVQPDVCS